MAERTLEIHALGARGDGLAGGGDKPVFVPGTLPGESVRAHVEKGRAHDVEIIAPSPDRVEPPCAHFGTCGGCKLQHMALSAYRGWKRDLVSEALAHAGISIEPEALVACEARSRRRAAFSVFNGPDGLVLGFQRAQSNDVVAIDDCHIITDGLNGAKDDLSTLASAVVPRGKTATLTVVETMTGLDIALDAQFKIGDGERRALSKIAIDKSFARVSVNGEIIIEIKRPVLRFGPAIVGPPSGAFVQAVKPVELAMSNLVTSHLKKCKRVADLFSGSGTFSIPLSAQSTVHAVEGDGAALAALDRGWREAAPANRLRAVTTEKRDLFNRPMTAKELQKFQGVAFDPPRAGAEAQARELAKSEIKRIAAISCNPATLARDLRILIDGGYALVSLTPLDQFLWSPHVEVVALLQRGKG